MILSILGLGGEATAAIVGAFVGGLVGFTGQLVVLGAQRRQDRRAGAQIIYGELATNLGRAGTWIDHGDWPEDPPTIRSAAWEAFGIRLLGGRGVDRVGKIAMAYSSLQDLAYLARANEHDPHADYSRSRATIQRGIEEVGRLTGLSTAELADRTM